MASPNTLELRRRMAALQPTEIPVEMPPVEPSAHVAVSVEMRRRSYLLNVQRQQRIAAENKGRDVPVSGVGRRRAKRHRQAGLCLQPDGERLCDERARIFGRCTTHLTPGFLRSRGEHQLASLIEAGGTLTRGRQYEIDTLQAPGWLLDRLTEQSGGGLDGGRATRLLGEWRDDNEATA